MFARCSSVCSLQPLNLRKNLPALGEPRTCPLHRCRDLDMLPGASSGRKERRDGLVRRDEGGSQWMLCTAGLSHRFICRAVIVQASALQPGFYILC